MHASHRIQEKYDKFDGLFRMYRIKSVAYMQVTKSKFDGFTSPPLLIASMNDLPSAITSLLAIASSVSRGRCSWFSENMVLQLSQDVDLISCLEMKPGMGVGAIFNRGGAGILGPQRGPKTAEWGPSRRGP